MSILYTNAQLKSFALDNFMQFSIKPFAILCIVAITVFTNSWISTGLSGDTPPDPIMAVIVFGVLSLVLLGCLEFGEYLARKKAYNVGVGRMDEAYRFLVPYWLMKWVARLSYIVMLIGVVVVIMTK